MDSLLRISLLFDFYGSLLTERQQEFMSLYHDENLSLSEIAEQFSVSRSAVHDSISKSEEKLTSYEEKLGLVRRFVETEELLKRISESLKQLEGDPEGANCKETLKLIQNEISQLENI